MRKLGNFGDKWIIWIQVRNWQLFSEFQNENLRQSEKNEFHLFYSHYLLQKKQINQMQQTCTVDCPLACAHIVCCNKLVQQGWSVAILVEETLWKRPCP